jgi:hypothetical protein
MFAKANQAMEPTPRPINQIDVVEVMMFRKEAMASEFNITNNTERMGSPRKDIKDELTPQKPLRLKKHEFTPLKVLDIQSMLARDYNYAKWDLIETIEIEHKLLRSLGLH